MVRKIEKLKLANLIIKSFVTRLECDHIKGGRPPNTANEGICTEEC